VTAQALIPTEIRRAAKRHDEEMGKVISIERPLPPTFEELELALA
jgi:hypothetical protein